MVALAGLPWGFSGVGRIVARVEPLHYNYLPAAACTTCKPASLKLPVQCTGRNAAYRIRLIQMTQLPVSTKQIFPARVHNFSSLKLAGIAYLQLSFDFQIMLLKVKYETHSTWLLIVHCDILSIYLNIYLGGLREHVLSIHHILLIHYQRQLYSGLTSAGQEAAEISEFPSDVNVKSVACFNPAIPMLLCWWLIAICTTLLVYNSNRYSATVFSGKFQPTNAICKASKSTDWQKSRKYSSAGEKSSSCAGSREAWRRSSRCTFHMQAVPLACFAQSTPYRSFTFC